MGLISYSIHHQQHGLDSVAQAAAILPQFLAVFEEPTAGTKPHPLLDLVRGRLTLSTCNRVELLLDTDSSATAPGQPSVDQRVIAHLKEFFPVPGQVRVEEAAISHLFQVAAGLDSMVIGEREISGQLRRALTVAQQQQTASHLISRVCQGALSSSRKVAHLTGLASQGRSVVACALDLVKGQYLADFTGLKVLLMGTGSYAGATVAALRSRGVEEIYAYSQSGRVQRFAQGHDLRAIDENSPQALTNALHQVDLVVTCRGLGTPILRYSQVEEALALKAGRQAEAGGTTATANPTANNPTTKHPINPSELVLLDLSLQADIEAKIAQLPGVQLITLQQVQRAVPDASKNQVARAHELIDADVNVIVDELKDRAMDPVVVALRTQYQQIVSQEIARLPQTDQINRESVEHSLRRLAARLAHVPTVNARRAARQGQANQYISALEQVLGVQVPVSENFDRSTCPVTGLGVNDLVEPATPTASSMPLTSSLIPLTPTTTSPHNELFRKTGA